ncbi:hypothetical protein L195_g031463 [Trifolium pratense]|uniref:Uncharacterized protein n=1 Tax=Trifolium pratense TaxID=57577 RepID=A0A2K3LAH7_TRIPR|nr:hypothetical protein L195_g031463 [Trifolium pratense]
MNTGNQMNQIGTENQDFEQTQEQRKVEEFDGIDAGDVKKLEEEEIVTSVNNETQEEQRKVEEFDGGEW